MLDWIHIVSNPTEERMKHAMDVGRARTWPNISMISNRLRIENAINRGRKLVRRQNKQDQKPLQQQKRLSVVTSDDASGSNDEIVFLAGRRASMPDGSGLLQEKEWHKEENRRRKFLAQFTDRREVIGDREIVTQEAESRAYDYNSDEDDESVI